MTIRQLDIIQHFPRVDCEDYINLISIHLQNEYLDLLTIITIYNYSPKWQQNLTADLDRRALRSSHLLPQSQPPVE